MRLAHQGIAYGLTKALPDIARAVPFGAWYVSRPGGFMCRRRRCV
ncbi:hypothetical protein BSIN_2959 [Burkholderia singularis]|uniref:Uncharacterized protein n=1 Tax=Burkholderia singularis TaxID=1503053 RepID=A0A238H408_9BURK|nr:hypothetical protein BSIN_2959 [Burkholderia singularis]